MKWSTHETKMCLKLIMCLKYWYCMRYTLIRRILLANSFMRYTQIQLILWGTNVIPNLYCPVSGNRLLHTLTSTRNYAQNWSGGLRGEHRICIIQPVCCELWIRRFQAHRVWLQWNCRLVSSAICCRSGPKHVPTFIPSGLVNVIILSKG